MLMLRNIRKLGVVTTLACALLVGSQSVSPAQQQDELADLYKQGLALYNAGRSSEAIPLAQRYLGILENRVGADHPDVAQALDTFALLYKSAGRLADAELSSKRSLAIKENAFGLDNSAVTQTLVELAELYRLQGRYAEAEPLLKRALANQEKALGPNHPGLAAHLDALALLYVVQARFVDAEPLAKRSLTIRENALGLDHLDVAFSLYLLGDLYLNQYRIGEAEVLLKRAAAMQEKQPGHDPRNLVLPLVDLGTISGMTGRYDEAEVLFKRALAIEETAGGDVRGALRGLANVYAKQGRYDDAAPLYERILAIAEKSGSSHPLVAAALHDLAGMYVNQKRYAEAESLYKRAIAIRQISFGSEHPFVETSELSLAYLYASQGRIADVLPLIRHTGALSHNDILPAKWFIFASLYGARARNLISKDEAITESWTVLQRGFSSSTGDAIAKLSARFAAGDTELARLVRQNQDLSTEEQRLDSALIGRWARLSVDREITQERGITERLQTLKAERDKLLEVLAERFPDYVALSNPQELSLRETQTLLDNDEALIVFDFELPVGWAWIITRTGADIATLKISGKDLADQVTMLRNSLTNERYRLFDASLAYRIYQGTFGAFADKIADKHRLTIVTNGALTSLPPQLLVTKDPAGKSLREQDWLVRTHAITILPSVASLKILRSKTVASPAPKPMIAFADPVFSKAARQQAQRRVAMSSLPRFYNGSQIDIASLAEKLEPLPGTRKEVQAISKALSVDATDIKYGLDATERAVKQARLDQYRIVYFATHGLVAGNSEEFKKAGAEPALVLTIPELPDETDDGLLQASEVAQLKLNADWVVLSACNTAAAEWPGAEPLSGLARAFFYAGARSLIVSHWDVDDGATAMLMVSAFEASSRDPKLSHAEALRQAMLSMLERAKTDGEAHPRLWAPFVVVGEPKKPN